MPGLGQIRMLRNDASLAYFRQAGFRYSLADGMLTRLPRLARLFAGRPKAHGVIDALPPCAFWDQGQAQSEANGVCRES